MRLPFALLCLSLAACGDEEIDELPCEVLAGNLSGTIAGQSFDFAAGETTAFLSDDESFFTEFFGEDYETCGYDQPDGPHLIVSVPTTPGEYEFTSMMNGTFVYDEGGSPMNEVTFSGVVVVDEVTDTTVSGALCMSVGEHEVSGEFIVDICGE
jgi:hypothetical protein